MVKTALTVNDFLRRAEQLYGQRIGVIDEPDQPAESWGSLTYSEIATRARAMAAGLDALGIHHGERVAMITQNSARLLTAFYAVSGSGRVLVPINFRLVAEEVKYIIAHSGARILLIDPELDEAMRDVQCEMKFVIGTQSDAALLRYGVDPSPWTPDEDATATINYTSGTTARPKGVQLSHRSLWLNAATFGWQMGVDDRDVYLHTLPMFHCNGWGMTYAVTGMGGRHVVLRTIDGAEILQFIRKDPRLSAVPVVLFTSSDSPKDRLTAMREGAHRFIRKPSVLEEYIAIGATLRAMLEDNVLANTLS